MGPHLGNNLLNLGITDVARQAMDSLGQDLDILLAAFILGLVFGVALGPCTFAYMAPMLAVTFKLAKSADSIYLIAANSSAQIDAVSWMVAQQKAQQLVSEGIRGDGFSLLLMA